MFKFAPSFLISAENSMPGDIHELVEALTAAMDAKNSYTRGHSDRVADLALAIAHGMGFSWEELYDVHVAAHLHDIGKIGIMDELLTKPTSLTTKEYEVIKTHSIIGEQILRKIRLLQKYAPIVRHHHEKFDGTGYPDALKREEIPVMSRIICLADAYDAMTSLRAYREGMTHDEAVAEIIRCSGAHFDPYIVQAFLKIYG